MLRYVCDRCKKVIDGLNDKPYCLMMRSADDQKSKEIDLCSGCVDLFNIFMLNDQSDGCDDPVEMPLAEDGFECPNCHAHYAFAVTAEFRPRIQVLRMTPTDTIGEGYICNPFVTFNCPICNQVLKIPESVLKEVNK